MASGHNMTCPCPCLATPQAHTLSTSAAIVKPKAGPSNGTYSEEDWNDEVDENAQGADAYRYSKVWYFYWSLLVTRVLKLLQWSKRID